MGRGLSNSTGMGTKLFAVAVAVCLCGLWPAAARDRNPPDALLVTETDSGEGVNYTTSTWARGKGKARYCTVRVADGIQYWESPPVQWVPGLEIAVRFETAHEPAKVEVIAFLLGDPTTGTAIYGKVDVEHELRRVEVEGRKVWEAVLSPPPWPDLYLDVTARWEDRDGCGKQESAWTFRAGMLPI